jgi:hypothetical protein
VTEPITVPVYLLMSMMGVITFLVVTFAMMVLKGTFVPARFYNDAVNRANKADEAKDEAVEVAKETLILNKRLAARDDVSAQVIEAFRKDAQWVRRQEQHQVGDSREEKT